jgi:hypothetical protein
VTHSCRSIFYYIIRTLLEEAYERTGERRIKMALPAVQFGSFHRLLKSMEQSIPCTIEFLVVDFNKDDWTLNQDSIDETEFQTCQLVLCQHLFGVPLKQGRLVALGHKYKIPILEDCVQSGSLYGKYKGHPGSDIIIYSGGLDKTPQCFGAGLGYFRNTLRGNHLYQKCSTFHRSLPMDTWEARFSSCFNQLVHLMFAKNVAGINNLIGLFAYISMSDRGDFIQWHNISYKIRKSKTIAPFQHAEAAFLRRPTIFQLQSILHGLSKHDDYRRMARQEIEGRNLLLSKIPKEYHAQLFPWMTDLLLQLHETNQGISEFTWVTPLQGSGHRTELCQFLNDHFLIPMINTTWETDPKTPGNSVSKEINDSLVYLPNINELTPSQIEFPKKEGSIYPISLNLLVLY